MMRFLPVGILHFSVYQFSPWLILVIWMKVGLWSHWYSFIHLFIYLFLFIFGSVLYLTKSNKARSRYYFLLYINQKCNQFRDAPHCMLGDNKYHLMFYLL